jgi:flagellar hook protein FlgE
MANALLTGISGLRGHQKMLEVIGNNLANVNTTGFKASRILFSDLVYETTRSGTSGDSQVLGSINPVQIGTGAQVAQIDHKFTQGNLEQSGEELDMAISGEGFFVVAGGNGESFFTRAGAFTLTETGVLVDSATGFAVQRIGTVGESDPISLDPAFQAAGDNRISIPKGALIPGAVTEGIVLSGNLPATSNGPIEEAIRASAPFLAGGVAATAATTLNALDTNLTDYVATDGIVIAGNDHDGSPILTTLALTATSTVGDLISAINTAYPQSTASLTAAGQIEVQSNTTGPSQLNLLLSDAPSNTGSTTFTSHNLVEIAVGQNADSFSKSLEVVDERGLTHSVGYTLSKQADTTWTLTATLDAADGTIVDGSVSGIEFNSDGSFRQVSGTGINDASLIFQFNNGTAPLTIDIDLGTSGTFNGLTEVGASESIESNADGFEPSTLTSVQVDANATLYGVTSTGRRFPLAQMAIATFGNPDGLSSAGNNFFQGSLASGTPLLGTALSGGRGAIVSQQLEGSNVDLTAEFTRLIIAQRGFSANARTITVTDEVLEELTNLIR